MIIKITNCSEDHYWYKNRVGCFYKVLNEGNKAYAVEAKGNTDREQAAVMVGDFEVVKNPYCYYIAYHYQDKINQGYASEVIYTDFSLDSPYNLSKVYSHLEKNHKRYHIVIQNFIRLLDY